MTVRKIERIKNGSGERRWEREAAKDKNRLPFLSRPLCDCHSVGPARHRGFDKSERYSCRESEGEEREKQMRQSETF